MDVETFWERFDMSTCELWTVGLFSSATGEGFRRRPMTQLSPQVGCCARTNCKL